MKSAKLWVALVIFAAASVAVIGCDVGVNPLLFDGSPVSAKYRVDTDGSSYLESKTVDLATVVEDIDKEIDSIKVFNVTLFIDSTEGTASGTTASGFVALDALTLVSLTDVPLSAFATERSIFDTTITGFHYNDAGVAHLISVLKQRPLPSVDVSVSGSTSSSPLHFTLHLKLYTQVFTTP